jgi:hypothetical protein
METRFVEAGNGFNWGKFLVARFDSEEWSRRTTFPGTDDLRMLQGRGWDYQRHWFVMDLQTGEGAMFPLDGSPDYDLKEKHAIWTCPMFLPFLRWLYDWYAEGHRDLAQLPPYVTFTEDEAPSALAGTRGKGNWTKP